MIADLEKISDIIRNCNCAGIAVSIFRPNIVPYVFHTGHADTGKGALITCDTTFPIASLSKLFTATAFMILRSSDIVSLDDYVMDCQPFCSLDRSNFPCLDGVRLRHLLTHQAGLPREIDIDYVKERRLLSTSDVLDYLPGITRCFEPSRQYKYSNLGYAILGLILQELTGQTLDVLFSTFVAKPLSLESMCFGIHSSTNAMPHILSEDSNFIAIHLDEIGYNHAVGGICCSVRDLALFFQSISFTDHHTRILTAPDLFEMQMATSIRSNWTIGAGIGWGLLNEGGKTLLTHSGLIPGYSSHVAISPDDNYGVVALSNSNMNLYELTARIRKLIDAEIVADTFVKDYSQSYDNLCGEYQWMSGIELISVCANSNGTLYIENSGNPPFVEQATLKPTDIPFQFQIHGGFFDAEIAHFWHEEDKIVGLKIGNCIYDRV